MKDSLGDRMKCYYEARSSASLVRRMPVIIRLDGCHFHTLTRTLVKPFDVNFVQRMKDVAETLVRSIQGCKLGYVQSDEISLLLIDYDHLTTQAWFDYNIQKIVSVSASMAAAYFNIDAMLPLGYFDSRAFNVPREDVTNYFIWRQKDCMRNSLNAYAQAFFSHKELMNKNSADKHTMLQGIGKNWHDLEGCFKLGYLIDSRGKAAQPVEIMQNRSIVDQYVYMTET